MALNLEKQLQFYGAYHHNPRSRLVGYVCYTRHDKLIAILLAMSLGVTQRGRASFNNQRPTSDFNTSAVNVAIHVTCVPAILVTAFLFGTNTPSVPLPPWLSVPNLPPNLGTIAAVVYSTLYVLMEPVAGGLLAPILIGATAYANHLTTNYGMTANYIALGVHVLSWVAQFIGHGVFEGRAPALLDNLVQALFLAPFFVWLEVLFMFGYRPELKARLDEAIQKDIGKFREAAAAKKATGQVKDTKPTNGEAK